MKKTNLTFKFPFPHCFGAQYNPSCLGPLQLSATVGGEAFECKTPAHSFSLSPRFV